MLPPEEKPQAAQSVARMSLTTKKALEMMSWEWTPYEDILEKLIRMVPPGKALRKYELRSKNTKGFRPLSEDEKIYSGARDIARDSIQQHVVSGRAEVETVEGIKAIRFKERRARLTEGAACPTCHRPFEAKPEKQATPAPKRQPRRPVVLYPNFPQWGAEQAETVSR